MAADAAVITRTVLSKGILASAQKRLGLVFLQIAAHGRTSNSNDDEAVGMAVQGLFENLTLQNVQFLEGVEIDLPSTLVSVLDKIGVHLLNDAKLSYDEVFRLSRSEGWALVQWLSLSLAVANELPQRRFETAWLLNDIDLGHPESLRRTWALAAIAELILQALVHRDLSLARGIRTFILPERDLKQEFREALTGLARMAWQEPNEVRSALLQLRRFDTDLIELVAMNSQSKTSHASASSSGASVSPASEPGGREFSSPVSTQYRTVQRRKLKSWISQEQYTEPSERSPSENSQLEWNCIRELRAFVRELIEPLFGELDILSYR